MPNAKSHPTCCGTVRLCVWCGAFFFPEHHSTRCNAWNVSRCLGLAAFAMTLWAFPN